MSCSALPVRVHAACKTQTDNPLLWASLPEIQRPPLQGSWQVMRPLVAAGALATAGGPAERMGVFVGIQQMEYGALAAAHLGSTGAFTATGTPFSVAAGRLSFHYGLKGPHLAMPPYTVCIACARSVQRTVGPRTTAARDSMLAVPKTAEHTSK